MREVLHRRGREATRLRGRIFDQTRREGKQFFRSGSWQRRRTIRAGAAPPGARRVRRADHT